MRLDLFGALLSWSKKLMRVTAYFAFVAFVLLFFGARSVWGSAEKNALDIGHGLVAMGDVLGPTYRVELNGEPMNVASATTDLTVGQVLDRFEKECRDHTGGLDEDFKRLSETLNGNLPQNVKGPAGLGILRKEEVGGGVVACLARDSDAGSRGVLAGLRELLRTGNMVSLGKLRYVAAETRKDGKTHVVSVWTDGSFRVGRMFPKDGDAPGADLDYVVRPPDARRVLTAGIEGAPFSVRVYDSAATPETVLSHYDRELPSQGWRLIDRGSEVSKSAKNGRAYMRAGVDLIVVTEKKSDGHSVVSLVAMPPR